MSWHYQVRKRLVNSEAVFDIVEVYENPRGWTVDGMAPCGESYEAVIECLEHMLTDAKKYQVLEDN